MFIAMFDDRRVTSEEWGATNHGKSADSSWPNMSGKEHAAAKLLPPASAPLLLSVDQTAQEASGLKACST
jgi:hypothetical protein